MQPLPNEHNWTSQGETALAAISAVELVERCGADHCEVSWQEFLNRYGWGLAASVRRALRQVGQDGRRDLEEDLLQETYCLLLADGRRRLHRCRGENDATVAGYLCRIAENVVYDYLRRSRASKRGKLLLVDSACPAASGRVERAIDPAAGSDHQALVRAGRRMFFVIGTRILTGRKRQRDLWITYLALFEQWTSREIAARLGTLSATNVDSVVYRTRRRLADSGMRLSFADSRR